jgi:hypothetical protein
MSNCALALARQGLDVLYISLELQEHLVADRFITMVTGLEKLQIKINRNKVKVTFEQLKNEQQYGDIHIKYMPADETSSRDIKSYIEQLSAVCGKKPDVLIVDYLDLMCPNEKSRNFGNVFERDKAIITELRNIGNNSDHPMVMISASQLNRSAYSTTERNGGQIAGGLSKLNTVDNAISIIKDEEMTLKGIAAFKLIKTRSSSGVGNVIPMLWDSKTLKFMDDNGIATKETESKKRDNVTKILEHLGNQSDKITKEEETIDNSSVNSNESNILIVDQMSDDEDDINELEDLMDKVLSVEDETETLKKLLN